MSPLKQQDLSHHSSCIPVSQLAPSWVLLPAVDCWEEEPHQPVQPGDPDGEQCVLPSIFCLQQWVLKAGFVYFHLCSTHIFHSVFTNSFEIAYKQN